jgi:DNA (cytosine-5)-methyltransferase 1
MSRPVILDAFCGAGGAAKGYHDAGFDVVGVDIEPQPNYPYEFHKGDALTLGAELLASGRFAAVHASPPCQAYSMITRNFGTADRHLDLLAITRKLLEAGGLPWIIENVPGAPMRADYRLCGCMFGLFRLRRERWFETSWRGFALLPGHHHAEPAVTITGHGMTAFSRGKYGRELTPVEKGQAMGIDWMTTWDLAQAIPPAYTQFIGEQLLAHLAAAVPS